MLVLFWKLFLCSIDKKLCFKVSLYVFAERKQFRFVTAIYISG